MTLDVLGGPGGQGMPIIRVLSSFLAMDVQICRVLSHFKGHNCEIPVLIGTPFSKISGVKFGLKID